ncbi:hypothetical protein AAFF_G00415390 [Aldrovandia affinis]|uniref:Uncharacterized protein n=1 Tax=Aldrovandia affinis TaxID=143900 RepID=A0AAD7SAW2_9TELE|nr:hypothetical protein AAFF_G00415390 [Aldrovandia affinis]
MNIKEGGPGLAGIPALEFKWDAWGTRGDPRPGQRSPIDPRSPAARNLLKQASAHPGYVCVPPLHTEMEAGLAPVASSTCSWALGPRYPPCPPPSLACSTLLLIDSSPVCVPAHFLEHRRCVRASLSPPLVSREQRDDRPA